MTLWRTIRAALLLRSLHRHGHSLVVYDSHCACHGSGWIVTLDGLPHYSPGDLLDALHLAETTATRLRERRA